MHLCLSPVWMTLVRTIWPRLMRNKVIFQLWQRAEAVLVTPFAETEPELKHTHSHTHTHVCALSCHLFPTYQPAAMAAGCSCCVKTSLHFLFHMGYQRKAEASYCDSCRHSSSAEEEMQHLQGYQPITILDNLYSRAVSWYLDISWGIQPPWKVQQANPLSHLSRSALYCCLITKKGKCLTRGDCWKQFRNVILRAKERRYEKGCEREGKQKGGEALTVELLAVLL